MQFESMNALVDKPRRFREKESGSFTEAVASPKWGTSERRNGRQHRRCHGPQPLYEHNVPIKATYGPPAIEKKTNASDAKCWTLRCSRGQSQMRDRLTTNSKQHKRCPFCDHREYLQSIFDNELSVACWGAICKRRLIAEGARRTTQAEANMAHAA